MKEAWEEEGKDGNEEKKAGKEKGKKQAEERSKKRKEGMVDNQLMPHRCL